MIDIKILEVSFLAAALAACSSSQYHVLVVPKLLSKFEFFGFLRVPYVTMGFLRVNWQTQDELRLN